MRELIIIRHALARGRDPKRWADDRKRPLSPKGRKQFRAIARGLGGSLPAMDLILTSPLERAKQTASILTRETGWPKAKACAALEPAEDPAALLARIRKSKASRIAVVGHEPHLSHLVGVCIAGKSSTVHLEMKKGGAAIVVFPEAVGAGSGMLTALLPARALRRMRS